LFVFTAELVCSASKPPTAFSTIAGTFPFTNVLPLSVFIPVVGLLLVSVYCLPLLLTEKVFGLQDFFVFDAGGFLLPHKLGLLLGVPVWTIIGVLVGALAFHTRPRKPQGRQGALQIVKRIAGMVIFMVISIYMLYIATGVLLKAN